tara:strand:- start:108 stop:305 length:198 start_codon:yes stop_codon:yes gene_type:complete
LTRWWPVELLGEPPEIYRAAVLSWDVQGLSTMRPAQCSADPQVWFHRGRPVLRERMSNLAADLAM